MPEAAINGRNAVLVLGPPRSGTSALSHVLDTLGVDFGDPAHFIDSDTHRHNPVFFELAELNALNEEILAALGWDYADFDMLVLEEDFDSALVDRFEPRIAAFLERNFDGRMLFGLKDPRFCFTLPLWVSVFDRLRIGVRCVLTMRDAEAVAASNFRVNPARGMVHAQRIPVLSVAAARCFLRGMSFETVHFDALGANQSQARSAIARLVGVDEDAAARAIDTVFDAELVHWKGAEFTAPTSGAAGNDAVLCTDYRELATLARRFGWQPVGVTGAATCTPLGAPLAGAPAASPRRDGGAVQVFHRRADEAYSEAESRTVPWPALAQEAGFSVEFDAGVQADFLRIDVDDHPGAFVVRLLEIDGIALEAARTLNGASGALLPTGAGGQVALLVNHDDPWLEFRIGGALRQIRIELSRVSLAEVGASLCDRQSTANRLDAIQARLGRIDDRLGQELRQGGALDQRLTALWARQAERLVEQQGRQEERFSQLQHRQQDGFSELLAQQRDVLERLDAFQRRTWVQRIRGWFARNEDVCR